MSFSPARCLLVLLLAASTAHPAETAPVLVELFEKAPEKWQGEPLTALTPVENYSTPAFAFLALPTRYGPAGVILDRQDAVILHATAVLTLPAGEARFLLRSRNLARLLVDGQLVAETPPITRNSSGHEPVPPAYEPEDATWHPLPPGSNETIVPWTSDGLSHRVELWAAVGSAGLRCEPGELLAASILPGDVPRLLAGSTPLTTSAWPLFRHSEHARLAALDDQTRRAARSADDPYWANRHQQARQIALLQQAASLDDQSSTTNLVDRHLGTDGLTPVDDASFFRRLSLDTTGTIPDPAFLTAFLADNRPDKRARAVDTLLADPRWADSWMGYWQDVLAENPGLLKPTLNNTGPFRRFLYEALRDNLTADRFVTSLIQMEGSRLGGGPAGFGMATENDAPMAAKAQILAKAFLAAELKCARCHDAPSHPFGQADLFALAGMLEGKPLAVPATSTVVSLPGARVPAVTVSLHAGETVEPAWYFSEFHEDELPDGLVPATTSPRSRLAALITSPQNARFARVLANRVWHRFLGYGLVEPLDDWDGAIRTRHEALLDDLARQLLLEGYDLKALARVILQSAAYQAQVAPDSNDSESGPRVAPARRRMSAEQILDSLFTAVGKSFDVEELTLDPDGRRPPREFLNLGNPARAWELALPSNERDRPALSLPGVQSLTDILLTFGWRAARPEAITIREEATTPLQPAILSNGIVAHSRIARLSDDSAITTLCLEDQPVEALVEAIYLRILSRHPQSTERERAIALLADGYDHRIVPGATIQRASRPFDRRVSWSNHLSPEATTIQLENEKRVRAGDTPTARLETDFRERAEDLVWALVNSPEFLLIP